MKRGKCNVRVFFPIKKSTISEGREEKFNVYCYQVLEKQLLTCKKFCVIILITLFATYYCLCIYFSILKLGKNCYWLKLGYIQEANIYKNPPKIFLQPNLKSHGWSKLYFERSWISCREKVKWIQLFNKPSVWNILYKQNLHQFPKNVNTNLIINWTNINHCRL